MCVVTGSNGRVAENKHDLLFAQFDSCYTTVGDNELILIHSKQDSGEIVAFELGAQVRVEFKSVAIWTPNFGVQIVTVP